MGQNCLLSICRPCAQSSRRSITISHAYSIVAVMLGAMLGGVLGSFISCACYRLPRGISLNSPARSYCASCGSQLTTLDLIPILSWLCLGGRCRHCQAPIGIMSLLVELVSAVVGALLVFWWFKVH
jgi:leader peptidase (prepilin peptidase) / N-methyltransferase